MSFIDAHLLTVLTFAPLIGAAVLLLLPSDARVLKRAALITSVITLGLAGLALSRFEVGRAGLQLVERVVWIPTLKVDYHIAVDGFSILLVLLTAIVVPLAIAASSPKQYPRTFFALVLVLETATLGVFTALNFFHWFIFWELSLVPAFFLVKIYGGPSAGPAALKFFLYTLVGSVAMLLAFQLLYLAAGTFDFIELKRSAPTLPAALARVAETAGLGWSPSFCASVVFIAILLAFAVKAPLWPFHTWLPDAYAEAPTPTTMLLTALLSKMGVYGLLRIALPLFPEEAAAMSGPLLALAIITVVAGALAAFAQTDLKRMMAYSSMNHVGYCLIGVFAAVGGSHAVMTERAAALDGAVLQMFNHGITAAALFFLIGLLESRTGKRGIDDFGGLRKVAPRFTVVFGIVTFASLGLPGLNSFVGELLIFKGALAIAPLPVACATLGIVVTAVFLLNVVQRVWWGPQQLAIADLSARELAIAVPFLVFIFWVGLYPGPFVELVNATARGFLR